MGKRKVLKSKTNKKIKVGGTDIFVAIIFFTFFVEVPYLLSIYLHRPFTDLLWLWVGWLGIIWFVGVNTK